MTVVQPAVGKTASPGAASIQERLRALAARPQSMTVRELIDRYMAQYAGQDTTRGQRLGAWLAMIGDFTLEQLDSDLMHSGRAELATLPPLVFIGLDDAGQKIFQRKGRASKKTPATLNRYMVAISAVFAWAIEQRLCPKGWHNPCHGIKRFTEPPGRVRFLSDSERASVFAACKASKYTPPAMPLCPMRVESREEILEM